MRITTSFIYANTRRTMQDSIQALLKAQEVMATQRKVNRLSDAPLAVGRILDTNAVIREHEQFVANLDTATTHADLYDGALDTTIAVLSRAKELLLGQANSATSSPTTREASRIEIVSLASQLAAVGNLSHGDRFLFAGYNNETAPFLDMSATATADAANTGGAVVEHSAVSDLFRVTGVDYEVEFLAPLAPGDPLRLQVINLETGLPVQLESDAYVSGETIHFDGIALRLADAPGPPPVPPQAGDLFRVATSPTGTYNGDSGAIALEIEQDVFHGINLTGDQVFLGAGLPDGVDLFAILERANAALRADDQAEIQSLLTEFDRAVDQIVAQQASVGANQNLFSQTSERLEDFKLNLAVLVSELRDADVAEAVIELNRREDAYQAVLGAAAKVIQPTLLDFLS